MTRFFMYDANTGEILYEHVGTQATADQQGDPHFTTEDGSIDVETHYYDLAAEAPAEKGPHGVTFEDGPSSLIVRNIASTYRVVVDGNEIGAIDGGELEITGRRGQFVFLQIVVPVDTLNPTQTRQLP